MKLGIVCTIFRPTASVAIARNYWRFRHQIANVDRPLVTVEVLMPGDEPLISDAVHLRSNSRLWHKEAALNRGVEFLPVDVDAVAFLDADITFVRDNWAEKTEQVLQNVPVCQPWSRAYHLDPFGRLNSSALSWAESMIEGSAGASWHPGFACAARRELAQLYDAHPLGAGDVLTMSAWHGSFKRHHLLTRLTSQHRIHFCEWARHSFASIRANIGVVRGDILHHYHGDLADRAYVTREEILQAHAFNPLVDIHRAENGLFEWSSMKINLHNDVASYFQKRKDDRTCQFSESDCPRPAVTACRGPVKYSASQPITTINATSSAAGSFEPVR